MRPWKTTRLNNVLLVFLEEMRGNPGAKTHLSLRFVEDAVHCVQHSHLLIKVQNRLFGELNSSKTTQIINKST